MDCVCWSNGVLGPGEESAYQQSMVTIYSNEEKTGFQRGKLRLTNYRLFWHDPNDYKCIIEIHLSQILSVELRAVSSSASNRSSRQTYSRLCVKLQRGGSGNNLNYICESANGLALLQFEFEFGGHNEFQQQLNQQLSAKSWAYYGQRPANASASPHTIGIAGIQRKIQDRLDMQDQKINDSFRDLSKLMDQAKDMVNISNSLIAKISKNTKPATNVGDDEDEDTKTLKSYFFNMGIIDNPVTKEGSGSKYYKALALEIHNSMTKFIIEHGGIMTLADVYCRLNRARGIAGLVSVEDVLNACKELNRLNCELKYNIYKDMNLHVLEVACTGAQSRKKLEEICSLVEKNESITPYALSNEIHSSMIVAKKLLLDAESLGMLCRDDTMSGLRFYPNLFIRENRMVSSF